MKNRDIKLITLVGLFILTTGIFLSDEDKSRNVEAQSEAVIKSKITQVEKSIKTVTKMISDKKPTIVQRRVVEKREILNKKHELRNKALLSKEQKKELDAYFSDSSNIRKAWLTLNTMKFGEFETSMNSRISATNFLIDGLKYAKSNRDEVIRSIEMFLISEKEDNLPLKEKKMVVGDKIDLYHALVLHAPEDVQKFKANYNGKRLAMIMKYVDHHMRRKQ